jgi:hypothetical protein
MIIDTHTHVISADTERFPLQVATNMPNEWVHYAPLSASDLLAQLDGRLARLTAMTIPTSPMHGRRHPTGSPRRRS